MIEPKMVFEKKKTVCGGKSQISQLLLMDVNTVGSPARIINNEETN